MEARAHSRSAWRTPKRHFEMLDNHRCRLSKVALCRARARSGAHASLHKKEQLQNLHHRHRCQNRKRRREGSLDEGEGAVEVAGEETLEVDQRGARAARKIQQTPDHILHVDQTVKTVRKSSDHSSRLRGAAISSAH